MKNWYTGLMMCLILSIGTQMKAQDEAIYKILYDARTIKVGEISNNGEWIGGGDMGIVFYYNTVTEKSKTIIDAEHDGMSVKGISNSGILLGRYGKGATAPAAYFYNNKWNFLPVPEDRTAGSSAEGISDDETIIGGYIAGSAYKPHLPCIWRLTNGEYKLEILPQPEKDITGEVPQGACVRDISADGSVLVGNIWNKDGFKSLPIFWKLGENSKYSYTVWGEDMVYDLNALNPGICPSYEDYVTAEKGTQEYEEQLAAYEKLFNDYANKRSAFYYGKGNFELRNIAVSGNGRWVVVGWEERGNPKILQAYRIDLQNNTAITLEGNRNTCPRSVLNDGTVIAFSGFNEHIWTGQVYEDEQSGQMPLYEWIREEKGVDISEDFLYTIPIIDPLTGSVVSEADSIVTGVCKVSKDESTIISYLAEPDNYSHIINFYVRTQSADNLSSTLCSQDIRAYVNKNILYTKGETKKLTLFDVTGKNVYHSDVVNTPLSLDFLQKGIYLVHLLTSTEETVINKILVE